MKNKILKFALMCFLVIGSIFTLSNNVKAETYYLRRVRHYLPNDDNKITENQVYFYGIAKGTVSKKNINDSTYIGYRYESNKSGITGVAYCIDKSKKEPARYYECTPYEAVSYNQTTANKIKGIMTIGYPTLTLAEFKEIVLETDSTATWVNDLTTYEYRYGTQQAIWVIVSDAKLSDNTGGNSRSKKVKNFIYNNYQKYEVDPQVTINTDTVQIEINNKTTNLSKSELPEIGDTAIFGPYIINATGLTTKKLTISLTDDSSSNAVLLYADKTEAGSKIENVKPGYVFYVKIKKPTASDKFGVQVSGVKKSMDLEVLAVPSSFSYKTYSNNTGDTYYKKGVVSTVSSSVGWYNIKASQFQRMLLFNSAESATFTQNVLSQEWKYPENGNLKIVKKDDLGNLVEGAKFQIWLDENENNELDTDAEKETKKEVVVNSYGTVTIENLKVGTYKIKEIYAAANYKFTSENVSTSVIEKDKTSTVEITNIIYPKVYIKKMDSETSETIAGIKFYIKQNGNIIETLTTNNLGISNSVYIAPGSYTIQEDEASANKRGYTSIINGEMSLIVSEDGNVTLDGINQTPVSGKTYEFTIKNLSQKGKIRIKKVDSVSNTGFDMFSNEIFEGIQFSIYKDVDENGVLDLSIDKWVQDLTTKDEQNEALTAEVELPVGQYIIREVTDDIENYIKAEDKVVTITNNLDETVVMANEPYGWLRLEKISSTSQKPLDGAIFAIYKGTEVNEENRISIDGKTEFTTKEGILELYLPKGEYLVKELSSPSEDYDIVQTSHNVSILAGRETCLTVENVPNKRSVLVTKVDTEGNCLEGVKFRLYKVNDDNSNYTFPGEYKGEYVTNSQRSNRIKFIWHRGI